MILAKDSDEFLGALSDALGACSKLVRVAALDCVGLRPSVARFIAVTHHCAST